MKSFSLEVKHEIIDHFEFNKKQCQIVLLSLFTGYDLWHVEVKQRFILDFFLQCLVTYFDLDPRSIYLEKKQNNCFVVKCSDEVRSTIEEKWQQLQTTNQDKFTDHDKQVYVLSAFLIRGNLSVTQSYYLEITSFNGKYVLYLQEVLLKYNISMSLIKRQNKYCLYLKKADSISDFLKFIHAIDSLLAFDQTKITRDFYLQWTRLNNIDIANLNKTTIANIEQIKKIKIVKDTKEFHQQSPRFKLFCQLRLKNKTDSLQQIAIKMQEKLKTKVSRTGLVHLTYQLNKLYNKITGNKNEISI